MAKRAPTAEEKRHHARARTVPPSMSELCEKAKGAGQWLI